MIAGDGSAEHAAWQGLARVGWAVVQWDEQNHNPQVAIVAEHVRVHFVCVFERSSPTVYNRRKKHLPLYSANTRRTRKRNNNKHST